MWRFFQQFTGINAVMYYGQTILIDAGFEQNAALIANVAPGVIAVIGGLIAIYNMEKINRRTTFVIGYGLTTLCHILIGTMALVLPEDMAARPWIMLVLIVAFVGYVNADVLEHCYLGVLVRNFPAAHARCSYGPERVPALDRERTAWPVLPNTGSVRLALLVVLFIFAGLGVTRGCSVHVHTAARDAWSLT